MLRTKPGNGRVNTGLDTELEVEQSSPPNRVCHSDGMVSRFSDRDEPLRYLRTGEVLVRCPRCAERAVATSSRVSCGACGYARADGNPGASVDRVEVRANGRCGHCGRPVGQWRKRWSRAQPRTLPVSCPGCRAITDLPVSATWSRSVPAVPRYRGLELWLQAPCKGEILWAYHEAHLDYLERYVAAGLREREPNRNSSLASRLPAWIKSAKNRDDVLRGLARMRASLPAGRAEGSPAPGVASRRRNDDRDVASNG